MKIVRVCIEGRVQGVGFRYWTANEAVALGLDGWVRNRLDSTVEAVFKGNDTDVDQMVYLCWQGPNYSSVKNVTLFDEDDEIKPGFLKRPTV